MVCIHVQRNTEVGSANGFGRCVPYLQLSAIVPAQSLGETLLLTFSFRSCSRNRCINMTFDQAFSHPVATASHLLCCTVTLWEGLMISIVWTPIGAGRSALSLASNLVASWSFTIVATIPFTAAIGPLFFLIVRFCATSTRRSLFGGEISEIMVLFMVILVRYSRGRVQRFLPLWRSVMAASVEL